MLSHGITLIAVRHRVQQHGHAEHDGAPAAGGRQGGAGDLPAPDPVRLQVTNENTPAGHVTKYSSLIGCSPELQFFLCSVHVPMCVQLPGEHAQDPAHTLIGNTSRASNEPSRSFWLYNHGEALD